MMGLFDLYEPKEIMSCPVCGGELHDWQGKCGPRGLFVWRQCERSPVDQRVEDEYKLSEEDRRKQTLPEEFEIYSNDCGCPYFVEAMCKCENEIWQSCELVTAENAVQKKHERRGEFKERLNWLSGHGRRFS